MSDDDVEHLRRVVELLVDTQRVGVRTHVERTARVLRLAAAIASEMASIDRP